MEDINAHHIILVNVLNEQTKPNLPILKFTTLCSSLYGSVISETRY